MAPFYQPLGLRDGAPTNQLWGLYANVLGVQAICSRTPANGLQKSGHLSRHTNDVAATVLCLKLLSCRDGIAGLNLRPHNHRATATCAPDSNRAFVRVHRATHFFLEKPARSEPLACSI